jgi:hypothetical protein
MPREKEREWTLSTSNGGRRVWEFRDVDGEPARIYESSEVGCSPRVWLGVSEVKHHHVTHEHLASMYLDCEQARVLAEALLQFARTGRLPDSLPYPRKAR